jgi:hypothetical protein
MSDARKIKRVRPVKDALLKLKNLAPVQYKNADADQDYQAGFIAQDLFKVFPEYVSKAGNDNGTVPIPADDPLNPQLRKGWRVIALDVLIPWIVSALQELNTDLDQLKKKTVKRVLEVDAKVAALEARIVALEASIPTVQQKIVLVEDRVTALEKINETLP